MKPFLLPAMALAVIAFFAFAPLTELPIGAVLPHADVKMKDVSGKNISFSDAKKEGGLLVMFSCNTCPYVVKNESRTNEIGKLAAQKNIGFILLNANEGQRNSDDAFTAMQAYAKKQSYNWYYVVDENSKMANAFGASRTPECFLFNKNGVLVYHGAIDDNPANANGVKRNHLKEAINEMLNGKDVSVKTSRSVGCAIKRKS